MKYKQKEMKFLPPGLNEERKLPRAPENNTSEEIAETKTNKEAIFKEQEEF